RNTGSATGRSTGSVSWRKTRRSPPIVERFLCPGIWVDLDRAFDDPPLFSSERIFQRIVEFRREALWTAAAPCRSCSCGAPPSALDGEGCRRRGEAPFDTTSTAAYNYPSNGGAVEIAVRPVHRSPAG